MATTEELGLKVRRAFFITPSLLCFVDWCFSLVSLTCGMREVLKSGGEMFENIGLRVFFWLAAVVGNLKGGSWTSRSESSLGSSDFGSMVLELAVDLEGAVINTPS